MKKNEVMRETEISAQVTPEASGASALNASAPDKKPFVEPTVQQPVNLLDVTAFFQGSAALDVAGSV